MNLELYDSNLAVQIYPLSKKFRPSFEGFNLEKKLQKYYGRHGGYIVGDGTASASKITLEYDQASTTDDDFISESRQLTKYLFGAQPPIYLRGIDSQAGKTYRWLIDIDSRRENMKDGLEFRIHSRQIQFHALDHFPENDLETLVQLGLNDTESMAVNNPGDIEAFPILEVTPTGGNLVGFTLVNDSTSQFITIDDAGFLVGKTYVLDFIDGLITLNGIERSKTISDGGPFYLRPANNSIRYVAHLGGGAIDLKVRFRERFGIF